VPRASGPAASGNWIEAILPSAPFVQRLERCLAGRTLEVEALTVASGARHGISTPLNRALLALLRAIDDATGGAS
jgi:hypothetical protein